MPLTNDPLRDAKARRDRACESCGTEGRSVREHPLSPGPYSAYEYQCDTPACAGTRARGRAVHLSTPGRGAQVGKRWWVTDYSSHIMF